MSLDTNTGLTPADIRACTCNDGSNSSGWGNGGWGEWIIVFLIFAVFGWGGFGGGFGGYGANGAANGALTRSDLTTDMNFGNIESGIRSLQNGLCDGFYAQNTNMLNGFSQLQNTTNQGFAGLNTAITTSGYETRDAINQLAAQDASCCCNIRNDIQNAVTQGVINTNTITQRISDASCANEKAVMQTNYNMATQNCQTLQAIDRVGDRIINYMTAKEEQNLRDENQALRLAASQQAQNNYLVQQLRPAPNPAYVVANPYCCNGGVYSTYSA